jgi:glycosyltransferase involved in cell wall biosynthesis
MDISIIIPCYNHGKYIREAIANLVAIKGLEYEVIIINDGSTDSFTNEELRKIAKEKHPISLQVLFQQNLGLAVARNNGIAVAKGNYILPLDADNKIELEYLIKSKRILDSNQDVHIVYAEPYFFGEIEGRYTWVVNNFDIVRMLIENYIDACAVYRKEVWKINGGYNAKMPLMGFEDWDFWLTSYSNGFGFSFIKEQLFHYRMLPDSMISNSSQKDKALINAQYLTSRHFELYVEQLELQKKQIERLEFDLKMAKRSFIRKFAAKTFNSFLKVKGV